MYCIDIPTLADMLRNPDNDSLSEDTYRVYAETVVERIVDLYNTPKNSIERDAMWDDIVQVFNYLMPATDVAAIIEDHLRFLTDATMKLGWDPRIQVKMVRHKLAKEYHKALIKMDLDATMLKMIGSAFISASDDGVADAVEDNPSLETLLEYERNLTAQRGTRG